jgi:hypothetical protein
MGVSTDAKLVFGINIGEEWIIPDPWNGMSSDDDDYWSTELAHFIEATTDPENPEVEIEYYCSCDFPLYIIAVPGTTICAPRGYIEVIEPERLDDMMIQEDAYKRYTEWCEKYLPEPYNQHDPAWLLCSMWC